MPKESEIAALRREVRALTQAVLAVSAQTEVSRDYHTNQTYQNQGAADVIAKS